VFLLTAAAWTCWKWPILGESGSLKLAKDCRSVWQVASPGPFRGTRLRVSAEGCALVNARSRPQGRRYALSSYVAKSALSQQSVEQTVRHPQNPNIFLDRSLAASGTLSGTGTDANAGPIRQFDWVETAWVHSVLIINNGLSRLRPASRSPLTRLSSDGPHDGSSGHDPPKKNPENMLYNLL
jgi:hypothetical protein